MSVFQGFEGAGSLNSLKSLTEARPCRPFGLGIVFAVFLGRMGSVVMEKRDLNQSCLKNRILYLGLLGFMVFAFGGVESLGAVGSFHGQSELSGSLYDYESPSNSPNSDDSVSARRPQLPQNAFGDSTGLESINWADLINFQVQLRTDRPLIVLTNQLNTSVSSSLDLLCPSEHSVCHTNDTGTCELPLGQFCADSEVSLSMVEDQVLSEVVPYEFGEGKVVSSHIQAFDISNLEDFGPEDYAMLTLEPSNSRLPVQSCEIWGASVVNGAECEAPEFPVYLDEIQATGQLRVLANSTQQTAISNSIPVKKLEAKKLSEQTAKAHSFVSFQGDLYFGATPSSNSNNYQLYRLTADGGEERIERLFNFTWSFLRDERPVVHQNELYFVGNSNFWGRSRLYRFDGSVLRLVPEVSLTNNLPGHLVSFGEHLYFVASYTNNKRSIFRFDPASNSVERIKGPSYQGEEQSAGRLVFFQNNLHADWKNSSGHKKLYRMNLATQTWEQVFDLFPSASDSFLDTFAEVDGWTYFSAYPSDSPLAVSVYRNNGLETQKVTSGGRVAITHKDSVFGTFVWNGLRRISKLTQDSQNSQDLKLQKFLEFSAGSQHDYMGSSVEFEGYLYFVAGWSNTNTRLFVTDGEKIYRVLPSTGGIRSLFSHKGRLYAATLYEIIQIKAKP
ncbi:MAG: hypothetical protein EA369_09025 [Bradymonadales bacterium]|nr:MAG: hypothetical protein EA369_09025 [Bradymonadales bacterium]